MEKMISITPSDQIFLSPVGESLLDFLLVQEEGESPLFLNEEEQSFREDCILLGLLSPQSVVQ